MTDADKDDNVEETDAPEETPEAAADEAPAVEEAPAGEPAAASAPAAGDDAEPGAPQTAKQKRKLERSRHAGEARPQRSVDERKSERDERRAKKAAERRKWRGRSRERRRAASSGQGTPPAEKATTGSPRVRQGVVVSDKADKTITVRIDVARQHRTYGKIVRSSSTLHAHDEGNEAGAGDTVRVVESRPISARKRWRLVEIVERAR